MPRMGLFNGTYITASGSLGFSFWRDRVPTVRLNAVLGTDDSAPPVDL